MKKTIKFGDFEIENVQVKPATKQRFLDFVEDFKGIEKPPELRAHVIGSFNNYFHGMGSKFDDVDLVFSGEFDIIEWKNVFTETLDAAYGKNSIKLDLQYWDIDPNETYETFQPPYPKKHFSRFSYGHDFTVNNKFFDKGCESQYDLFCVHTAWSPSVKAVTRLSAGYKYAPPTDILNLPK